MSQTPVATVLDLVDRYGDARHRAGRCVGTTAELPFLVEATRLLAAIRAALPQDGA